VTSIGNVAAVTTDSAGSTRIYYQNAGEHRQRPVRTRYLHRQHPRPSQRSSLWNTYRRHNYQRNRVPDPRLFRIAQLHFERVRVDRNDLGWLAGLWRLHHWESVHRQTWEHGAVCIAEFAGHFHSSADGLRERRTAWDAD
jgi:hypothetical protein